jgi:hypothetical protein
MLWAERWIDCFVGSGTGWGRLLLWSVYLYLYLGDGLMFNGNEKWKMENGTWTKNLFARLRLLRCSLLL